MSSFRSNYIKTKNLTGTHCIFLNNYILYMVLRTIELLRGLPFIFRNYKTKTNIYHSKWFYCFSKYFLPSSTHYFIRSTVFLNVEKC